MNNRYDDILRIHNQDILDVVPYNPFLFTLGAFEIRNAATTDSRVLEIGSGEGDSAVPVLRRTDVKLDLLDVSPEMIEISKHTLEEYSERTTFICEDALEYLAKADGYDIIFAAWTLHNFPQDDKKKLLSAIRENLADGGMFILLDKVYPMTGQQELLEHQNARYRKYLSPDIAKAVIAHEIEDASDAFRMDQDTLLATFSEAGFASAEILDRIERDVILVAKK